MREFIPQSDGLFAVSRGDQHAPVSGIKFEIIYVRQQKNFQSLPEAE